MAKSQNKTVETKASAKAFLAKVANKEKRADCETLAAFLEKETGHEAKMWGTAIIGYGTHHYKYESGREGDMPLVAFSPRSSSIALYLSSAFPEREELLKKLGKHKASKGCVHINKLADIDLGVLRKIVKNNAAHYKKTR